MPRTPGNTGRREGISKDLARAAVSEVNMPKKYLRYPDLVDAGIVNNRTTLTRWIKTQGFPEGVLLGPSSRAWPVDEVEAWLASRANSATNRAA